MKSRMHSPLTKIHMPSPTRASISISYAMEGEKSKSDEEDLKDIWRVCTHILPCKVIRQQI